MTSQKGWIRASKKAPCILCGKPDWCSFSPDGGAVLCRRIGFPLPGWKRIKTPKDGAGDVYVLEKHQEFDREQWKRERDALRKQQERDAATRRENSLSVIERDREFRKLLDQLSLDPADGADLIRRGLTPEQIKLGGFKSISRREKLDFPVNNRLPGINPDGRSFHISWADAGILCPIFSAGGLIVGCQLRRRENADIGGGSRYKWLTSKSDCNPHGATSHLPNGELPITIQLPQEWNPERAGEVGLCEGTGIKPFLAAQRLGIPVIGASSGNFASSPEQLREAIGKLAPKRLSLLPDGGSRTNSTVLHQYRRTVELLGQWGHEVSVAWWGQTSKDACDIDEIEGEIKFDLISWEEFSGDKPEAQQSKLKQFPTTEPEPEIDTEGIWTELTQLTATPWKTINTPTLDLEALNLEPGAAYIISSAKGTHKTNSLKPIVPQHKNVYAWFNRIALGREECHRVGIEWKDDLKRFGNSIKVGFCSDSSYQFNPATLKDRGLLLVDEADQVFDHNFGDTCNKHGKRPLILSALQSQLASVMAGNGIALFMSADITDKEVDYIKAIAPSGCPVRLIVNEYKPQLGDIYFDTSATPDGQIQALLNALESGEPCFVIDDIKDGVKGCKSIAEYIRKVHPEWADEIVEINGDSSGDPAIIAYLKDINQASLKTRALICSPSVVSGISIQNGHFTGVYGFSNGVLTVSQMSQAIARVRGAESINLWVAEKGLIFQADRSLFPEDIKAYYQRNYEANAKHILAYNAQYNPLKDEWSSPHFDLYCKNAAYRNNCMIKLRARMRERLEREGYSILDIDNGASETVAGGLIESWHGIELSHAEAVANASILTDEQLRYFEDSAIRPTPEQQLDIKKTFLLKTYGQELIDAMTFKHKSGVTLNGYAAMLLKDNKGEYRKQLEAFYLLRADESEAIAKDLAMENRQLDNGKRFAADVRWRTRQRKARIFLGLDKFLDPHQSFSPINFAGMAAKAKQHSGRIKDALGIDISKMTAGQIYGELMGQLGLELDKQWAPTPAANGRRYKLRKISAQSWEYAQMYVRHRTASEVEDVPVEAVPDIQIPDHPPGNISSKGVGGGDQGLDHAAYGLEPSRLHENNSAVLVNIELSSNVPVEPISPVTVLTPEQEEESEITRFTRILSEVLDTPENQESRTHAQQLWSVFLAWGEDVGKNIAATILDRLTAGKQRQLQQWGWLDEYNL